MAASPRRRPAPGLLERGIVTSPPSRRLRRVDRLRSSKDFARVKRAGRRCAGPHLVVQMAPARAGSRQLGLVVGRRVGPAVTRNRVKRRVREWFRTRRELLPEGTDLVVIARSGAAGLDGPATWRELEQLVVRCSAC